MLARPKWPWKAIVSALRTLPKLQMSHKREKMSFDLFLVSLENHDSVSHFSVARRRNYIFLFFGNVFIAERIAFHGHLVHLKPSRILFQRFKDCFQNELERKLPGAPQYTPWQENWPVHSCVVLKMSRSWLRFSWIMGHFWWRAGGCKKKKVFAVPSSTD